MGDKRHWKSLVYQMTEGRGGGDNRPISKQVAHKKKEKVGKGSKLF